MTDEATAIIGQQSGLRICQTSPDQAKVLVLGLGNPLLGDDSVGLRVAQQVRLQLAGRPDVEVAEDYWGGLRLMERLAGFERAVIVDAICAGGEPGTVRVLSPDDMPTRHSASAHDVDLRTALALGRRMGARLPQTRDVRVVAIETADVWTFTEECTPAVQAGIGHAVQTVLTLLAEWR
jgi:hydrogenase maturation protease